MKKDCEKKKNQLFSWFLYTPFKRLKKKTHLSMGLFYTLCRGLLEGIKKEPAFQLVPLYPQAVSNRCCGNENPESWATRR